MENYSKPSVANFGRSLFGGYCPSYVPDFVLHGMPSDEKLRQSLMAELTHAVQVRDRSVWTYFFKGAIHFQLSVMISYVLLAVIQSDISFFLYHGMENICKMIHKIIK